MSNSAAMTLEEKLVQHIKTIGLGALIDDEDAIAELTKRAIDQALLQPQRIRKEYGGYEERDSLVVAAARVIASKAIEGLTAELVKHLSLNRQVQQAVLDAVVAALPAAIAGRASQIVSSGEASAQANTLFRLQEMVRNNGGKLY